MDSTDMQDFWGDNEPFPATSERDWRDLVEQTVERAKFESALVHTDLDGIARQPVYPQRATDAIPGQFPYTRGSTRASSHGWTIAQSYDTADASQFNRQLLHELEGGVGSIELHLAPQPTGGGLQCDGLNALDTALAGVQLELIHVALAPRADNIRHGALLLALCRQRGLDAAQLQLSLNIDPLGALAQHGSIDLAGDWREAIATTAHFIGRHYPAATALCADASPYHNSGASAARQIACAIATGIDYLRALTAAGVDATAAARQIEFRLALDSELFESVAMHRAMRTLWAMVLQHSGVAAADGDMCLRAVSGHRCLTRRDPAVNMLRVTTQCLAAALGGADSFNSAAFDQLIDPGAGSDPTHFDKGRRIARNTQLILMEESGIHLVRDPMGGSGHIEALTDSLAERAWHMVQQIEADGGMFEALSNGAVQSAIADTCRQRSDAIAHGVRPITGVSEFPLLDETAPPGAGEIAADRDTPPVFAASALEPLIDHFQHGAEAVAPSDATTLSAAALPAFRDAAAFEALRDRADAHRQPPTVALITLGEQKDYGARVNFSRNFFAAAGIHTQVYSTAEWLDASARPALAVLCASDPLYREHGSKACADIAASGDTTLWIAGKRAAIDDAPNLEREISIRCDRVALLTQALDALEVAAA